MITIVIHTDNVAFDDRPEGEVARILRRLADELEDGREPSTPCDIKGHACGTITIEGDTL